MNINLPTPKELKAFQIEHYTELLKKPQSFKQKIFIRKQLNNLKHENL